MAFIMEQEHQKGFQTSTAPEKDLYRDLRERDIILSDGALRSIADTFDYSAVNLYYNFLHDFNQRGGFFSASDSERIAERHVLESLLYILNLIRLIPVSRETTILDAGTGPGLPGFLFACLKEVPRLFLLDSSRRRLSLLEDFVKESENQIWKRQIRFLYERAEESKGRYHLITARAMIPYPHILELFTHLQAKGDYVALFSASLKNSEEEKKYLSHLGYTMDKIMPVEELSFLGTRSLSVFKKTKPADSGYPRAWKYIKQEMDVWEK